MSKPYSAHRPAKNSVDAIRLFCLECMGSSVDPPHRADGDVRDCPSETGCSLWPYRFGKDPVRSAVAKEHGVASNLPVVIGHTRSSATLRQKISAERDGS